MSIPASASAAGTGRRTLAVAVAALALVAVAVVVGQVADRPTTPGADDPAATVDGDVRIDEPRGTSVPPSRVDRPTCGDGADDCFLWVAELDRPLDEVVVGGGFVVGRRPDGSLTGWALRDGTEVWSVDGDAPSGPAPVVVGDLLLRAAGTALIATELDGGAERWRADLGEVAVLTAHDAGDVLVVAADVPPADDGDGRVRGVAAGLDPATGEVVWREDGSRAAVAAGGVAIVTTDAGDVVALEPTGEPRWELDARLDREADGHALAAGHVVFVFRGARTAAELHTIGTGDPLDLSGGWLVDDERHTLLRSFRDDQSAEHVLVDDDGVVWRTDPVLVTGCDGPASLEPDRVVLTTCEGARTVLDRDDGSESAREPAPRTRGYSPENGYRVGWFGPYQLRDTDPLGGRGDQFVIDTRDDRDVASLPPGTEVLTVDERGHPVPADGVVLLGDARWLVAVTVPVDGG